MLTKEMLNKASSQNILCFDIDNKEGELSYKLVAIMIDVARLNYDDILTKLYIPSGLSYCNEYKTFCGLKVYHTPELCAHGELYKYYKEDLGGSLFISRKDKTLIVATGPNDAVMIGSMQ